jgi:SAM-dependent methyltransferase
MNCCLCNADTWLAIPNPVADRSITTAGILLNQPLSKSQCENCGLMRRVGCSFVGDSDYYEENYGNYYLRPGAQTYDAPRYAAIADWMRGALAGYNPKSILDVGCGAGWSMRATRQHFRDSQIEGIEPSRVNAELARQAGFHVLVGKIGEEGGPRKVYDLIYANNVLQHVLSPLDFLAELFAYLSDDGLLVLICPDATRPSNEMLWCDHNYSFSPHHLAALAEKAGYHVRSWSPNPDDVTVLDKQLIVLAKGPGFHAPTGRQSGPTWATKKLYRERCNYIERWQALDGILSEQTRDFFQTFNFGSSSWTWLLAGYCPDYWRRVESCAVDQHGGKCLDKIVKPLSDLLIGPRDGLVLGVNPVSQAGYARRFENEGWKIVRWDQYIDA